MKKFVPCNLIGHKPKLLAPLRSNLAKPLKILSRHLRVEILRERWFLRRKFARTGTALSKIVDRLTLPERAIASRDLTAVRRVISFRSRSRKSWSVVGTSAVSLLGKTTHDFAHSSQCNSCKGCLKKVSPINRWVSNGSSVRRKNVFYRLWRKRYNHEWRKYNSHSSNAQQDAEVNAVQHYSISWNHFFK